MVKAGTYTGNLKLFDNDVSLISADGNLEATIRPASQHGSTISGFGLEDVTIQRLRDRRREQTPTPFTSACRGRGFSDPVRNLTIKDNKIHSSGEDGVKVSQAYNVEGIKQSVAR